MKRFKYIKWAHLCFRASTSSRQRCQPLAPTSCWWRVLLDVSWSENRAPDCTFHICRWEADGSGEAAKEVHIGFASLSLRILLLKTFLPFSPELCRDPLRRRSVSFLSKLSCLGTYFPDGVIQCLKVMPAACKITWQSSFDGFPQHASTLHKILGRLRGRML